MTEKQGKGGDAGAAAVDDPARLRNVALVGPSGAGKTTLAEALVAAAGSGGRTPSSETGAVFDHDPVALRQQRSVGLAVAPLLHRDATRGDVKINLIDTPGYADFVGELRAGLRAADAALFVVSAGHGVDAATVTLWQECARVGMPRAVLVSRLDHARADVDGEIAACAEAFGDGVLPLYLPSREGTALIGLITGRRYDYASGHPPVVGDPDPADLDRLATARDELIEGIIAESEDESLMDRYLAGEDIPEETLIADLETAVSRGAFHPVIPVCAETGVGLAEVLDGIAAACPSPLERAVPLAASPEGIPQPRLAPDPEGPLAAEIIRTTVDSFVGRVSLARVFSGRLQPDRAVHVSGHGLADRGHADHDEDERLAHLYSPFGAALREIPYAVAGDICALTKISSAETGDTLSTPDDPLLITPWDMPEPQLPMAVVAANRSDEDALARNLGRLVAADPTLRLERNAETSQLVVWCTGEAHADVVLARLCDGGADVTTEPVRIPLRETFARAATGHGKHVKQSGGHGQYAVCDIEVEPLPRGAGVEFADRVVGGAVPHQFIPSVEKGVRAQLAAGITEGRPIVDVRVTLVDGKAHSVDSSDAAFQTAGALAIKAAATAGLTALEPLDEVEVRLPDTYFGAVLGDLSSRRGRVLGTEAPGGGTTVIRAEVPATELLRYAVDLRSITSGTATFSRHHVRYDPAPDHAAALR
ncbi:MULTISPECIES: elongation factor G-like protein EF-G2 [Prauserella salsuginis group]|uniref:Elongation factor G-like protein EF-G2 n=1 Tax=Prauserella salsuginis TaxID=387889 RepID=A0ABW6GAA3_9PSEU|nr:MULTISPECIES: elongation factor G-like protein EF-G2 [Prauserella salsuginis group]MCR3723091.1 elongation factor G [Prauserella flava]MCR3732534.1 elongation factor G [Prauserella salsuginis]